LVVVSHPDDESIWMGGTILRHDGWEWRVLVLCRAGDPDREPRFHRAARELGVSEHISDLDDSPVLAPLSSDLVEIRDRVLGLPLREFDLIFTHGPAGEYTYHLRHGQAHEAVRNMIAGGDLAGTLVTFAYEDCGGGCNPRPGKDADIRIELTAEEFARKRHILRDVYNFGPGSFEFEAAGPVEAFRVRDPSRLDTVKSVLEDTRCES
jgi:LmbE family N-acetylglucosaminyl deacetylase